MGSTRSCMLLSLFLFAVSTAVAQEANFGLKVKCYIKDGTVVCPGCNFRAGLSCPRSLKTQSCNIKTEAPYTDRETTPTAEIHNDVSTTVMDEATKPADVYVTNTADPEPETTTHLSIVQQEEEIDDWVARSAKDDLEFRIFLYHIMRPIQKRLRREVQDDGGGTCNWNEDCPCPLICCKMGDGCPKRCLKGIRLPPPWG